MLLKKRRCLTILFKISISSDDSDKKFFDYSDEENFNKQVRYGG